MREEGGYSSGSMFLSFLFGGIVGAAVALLLAPESGRDTRHKIKEFAGDMKDKVRDYAEPESAQRSFRTFRDGTGNPTTVDKPLAP